MRARIGNLIHHFDDLKKAHDAVLRAKDQIALLTPIREGAARHATLSREDQLARQQRDQLHPWFTDQKLQLSLEHQPSWSSTGQRLQEDSAQAGAPKSPNCGTELAAVQEDIRTNGGGRLAAIDAEVARLGEESRSSARASKPTPQAAADLGLRPPEDRVLFDANRARLAGVETELADQADELQDSRTELTMTRTVLTGTRGDIAAELTSLQSRPNLLPLPPGGAPPSAVRREPALPETGAAVRRRAAAGPRRRSAPGRARPNAPCAASPVPAGARRNTTRR